MQWFELPTHKHLLVVVEMKHCPQYKCGTAYARVNPRVWKAYVSLALVICPSELCSLSCVSQTHITWLQS